MDSTSKNLHTIDINELSSLAEYNAIRNFYLSEDSTIHRFLAHEVSFIFNGFTLGLCTSGSCNVKLNGRNYVLRAGSLLLLSPNQLMEVSGRSDDFTRKIIVFSLDLVLEFPSPMDVDIINTARRRPVLDLSQEQMTRLLEYYEFLKRAYEDRETPYREAISKTILYALMLEIFGLYERVADVPVYAKGQRQEQLTDDFFLLLAQYYKSERNVSFYAEKMNRTPKYLSGEIKRITGRSILEWINEAVLIEMKVQLKTTDYTVLQISEALNFSSPSVFVQFFKHHTGITPLQYRKQG